MKSHERFIVISVFAVLVFAWLGFLLHVSPRFAGSGLGAAFGIAGAGLMLVPLLYVFAKRIPFLRERVTQLVSLQTWLSIHIYTGIVGALLALIHTGHKYVSPLGIALTATMLLVVVSGIVLRRAASRSAPVKGTRRWKTPLKRLGERAAHRFTERDRCAAKPGIELPQTDYGARGGANSGPFTSSSKTKTSLRRWNHKLKSRHNPALGPRPRSRPRGRRPISPVCRLPTRWRHSKSIPRPG